MPFSFREMRSLLTLFSLLICNLATFGVSAYPQKVEILQPNGSRITVILRGDERMKWAETVDGYSIIRNNNGDFEYAKLDPNLDMVPSGVAVNNVLERSDADIQLLSTTKRGLSFSVNQVQMMKSITRMYQKRTFKSAQISGARKFLCILIGFSDKAFTKTKADFENLLNQIGYSTDGAVGSVYDYYNENSYGKLNLSFTVAGPYVASHTMSYYGANDKNGYDTNPEALVGEAVTLADTTVDYSEYDNDKDGTVDGVYVIHAGYGEDSGASANTIWAHTGSIPQLTLDGKTISDYACSSELRGISGTGITRIGTICHELGHILGTMDFYDTNYTTNGTYDGTGQWDIMADGSWNNNGVTPAHHNPYSKIVVFGWAESRSLTSGAEITLFDSEGNDNSFYRINTATSNEYFLIENKQKQKFDSFIPGHGMIIYHVDGNYISSTGNAINTGSHQGLYPVCATATGLPPTTYGVINSSGLTFPGTGNKTSFTDLTTPNALSWSLAKTNTPLTNITENNTAKTVTFTAPVLPNRPGSSVANPATNILQATFIANWNLSSAATGYRLDVSTNEGFTSFVSGYNDKDVGNVKAFNVSGLTARTVYYYRVRGINLGGTSDNSNVISLKTLSVPPAVPTKLAVVSCNNLVTLSWQRSSDPYLFRYRIYGGTTINPTTKIDSSSANSSDTLKIISGLTHGQTYYFRISAVNDDGPESTLSSQVYAIVKTGVIPLISMKWGDILICSNLSDSIKTYQWNRNNTLIPEATGQYFASDKVQGVYTVTTTDSEGCKNTSNAISNNGLKSISIYPNPVLTGFTLHVIDPFEGDAIISIVNSMGVKVMELQASSNGTDLLKEISVSGLDEGIYLVNVLSNQKILYSTKIIVKK